MCSLPERSQLQGDVLDSGTALRPRLQAVSVRLEADAGHWIVLWRHLHVWDEIHVLESRRAQQLGRLWRWPEPYFTPSVREMPADLPWLVLQVRYCYGTVEIANQSVNQSIDLSINQSGIFIVTVGLMQTTVRSTREIRWNPVQGIVRKRYWWTDGFWVAGGR